MVGARHAQHLADHRIGDPRGVIGHHVEFRPALQLIEQPGGQLADIAAHALDHRQDEGALHQGPEARVLGRIQGGNVLRHGLQRGAALEARVHPQASAGRPLAEPVRTEHPVAVFPAQHVPEPALGIAVDRSGLAQPPIERERVALALGRLQRREQIVSLSHVPSPRPAWTWARFPVSPATGCRWDPARP